MSITEAVGCASSRLFGLYLQLLPFLFQLPQLLEKIGSFNLYPSELSALEVRRELPVVEEVDKRKVF